MYTEAMYRAICIRYMYTEAMYTEATLHLNLF